MSLISDSKNAEECNHFGWEEAFQKRPHPPEGQGNLMQTILKLLAVRCEEASQSLIGIIYGSRPLRAVLDESKCGARPQLHLRSAGSAFVRASVKDPRFTPWEVQTPFPTDDKVGRPGRTQSSHASCWCRVGESSSTSTANIRLSRLLRGEYFPYVEMLAPQASARRVKP